MFCKKCGFQTEEPLAFCPRCGSAASEANETGDGMRKYFSTPSGAEASGRPISDAGQSSGIRFSKSFSGFSNTAPASQGQKQDNGASRTNRAPVQSMPSPVKKRSKTLLLVSVVAGSLLVLGILAIVLIPKLGHFSQNGGENGSALSNNTTDGQVGQSDPDRAADDSYLHGSWNYYTGGIYGAVGSEVTMLQLNADGTARLDYYVANSDVGSSYEGVWSADETNDNAVMITLNMRDASTAVGEDRGDSYRYIERFTASVFGDTLEIINSSGDLAYFDAGMRLENGLTIEDWASRMEAQGYWSADGGTKQLAWDITGTWDGYDTNFGTGWYELEITVYAADQESVTADWAYTSTDLYDNRRTDTGDSSDIWVIEYNDEYLEIGVQYGTSLTGFNKVYFYSDGTAVVEFPFIGSGQMTHTPL